MSREKAYTLLEQLLPAQFEKVLFLYDMPEELLRREVALSQQIIDLIKYAEQREAQHLPRLCTLVENIIAVDKTLSSTDVKVTTCFTSSTSLPVLDNQVFRDQLLDGSLGPEMVVVPAGRFRMGDIQGEGYENEQPVHWVSIASFAIGCYEVTFAEYDQFAQVTGRELPNDEGWGRDQRPVINVSWYDAVAYAQWLSQQTGKQYRLPMEAEWEYAARAGTETNYWWGNEIGQNRANCWDCGSQWDGQMTAPVGSFAPNPFGLYDTVGNVWEWTCSKYVNSYHGQEQSCANNVNDDSPMVIRGGYWDDNPRNVRVANRYRYRVSKHINGLGFRLVRM